MSARFPVTRCSQCASEFSPGNEGYSHCSDHRDAGRTLQATASLAHMAHMARKSAEQQRDEAQEKARRYDWLSANFLGADFDWNEGNQVLVIRIPHGISVCGDLGMTVDTAMARDGFKP